METEAPETANQPQSPHPVGTVRINDDRVTFHTDLGLELEAIGVQATRTNRHLEGIAPGVTTQRVNIHRLVGKLPHSETPRYASTGWRMYPHNTFGATTSKARVLIRAMSFSAEFLRIVPNLR